METSSLKQPKTFVVLVDDDKNHLELIKKLLEQRGYPVLIFLDPFTVISFVMEGLERPAIVMIDYDMPESGYTGNQLIKHLDMIKVYPLLSFLIADQYDRRLFGEALDNGAIGYLSKITPEEGRDFDFFLKHIERAERLIQDELTLAERLDSLTGMYNVYDREGGRRKFRHVWREARKKNTITSGVFIDVNGLKMVNTKYGKEYGYSPGDRVILALAKLLHVRSSDLVIRFGGDEFFIVLQRTAKSRALKVLARLKKEAPLVSVEILPGVHFKIMLSGGVVSVLPRDLGDDPDSLFESLMSWAQKLERKDKLDAREKALILTRSEV